MSLDPGDKILSIDIGGSRIKATVLNADGEMSIEYQKIQTPSSGAPHEVIDAVKALTKDFPPYDKISLGFPGYVRNGKVYTAPNLGTPMWEGVQLSQRIADALRRPVRMVNDAELQGMGVVRGTGLEMVITLGTGFGTALFLEGSVLPALELAHHPITKKKTYDQYLGDQALADIGDITWNRRIERVLPVLKTVFNFDHLYIGGGNAKKISFPLHSDITIVSNREGIRGGARLWEKGDIFGLRTVYPS